MSRRERQRQRQRNRRHPVRRAVLMSMLVGFCALVTAALVAVGWVVAVADSAPDLNQLKPHALHPLSEVFAANGTPLGYIHSDSVHNAVSSDQIPLSLKQATVAIEDRRFYQHGALDYQGILRAGIKDLFGNGSGLQGASTLTMQLVNNEYLVGTKYDRTHNLRYKIIQAKLAEELQKGHTKNWILTRYLNVVPYGAVNGETAYGVGAAAEMFFDKPVRDLDLAQSALLAGLPQAPTTYNPFVDPQAARVRRKAVLQAMVQSHDITQAQADAAAAEPLQVRQNPSFTLHRQPYLFDFVVQQLDQKLCPRTPDYCPAVKNGGLKVYTTLDLKREQEAQQAILNHQPGGPNLDAQPAAALASIDPTNGHILAMASSATYSQTKYFYPVDARRQTGSAFKVFALMTLIHDYDGDPNQTYYTSKFLPAGWLSAAPTWSVHTAELTYQGTINVTKATIVSDNTVFAQLAADLGWKKLDAIAHAMGITSQLNGYPSEVIGGLADCCTMLEMADAYATIANGGSHIAPTIINQVVFPDGSTVNFGDPPRQTVFSSGETYAATKVLEGVIQSGTGTAANYGCPAAGKTGTAQNMDNAWFVGYTPQLSTAVWVGYPQANIPMSNGFGGALAAPIWHDYMLQASNGYCGDFPQPSTYWTGTAFTGAHSGFAPAPPVSTGTTGTGTSTNPYNNPTLFAQPPQPTGGGTPGPSGGGQHGGTAPTPGNGNGNGNGGTGGAKH
jgi:penicillin-binding protein 1A